MKKTSKSVVFFGSGPVAARSLELLSKNFEIEAVVTKPRAEHHKGSVPVLDVAERLSLQVMTATDRNSLDELIGTKPFKSDLGILIDFGIIVSQKVIDYFPLGIINSHFSILPEWRGADPITFSILSGQKSTGVSLMLLTAGLDEGPLLSYGTYELPPDITTPLLTEHLVNFSVTLLEREVQRYVELAESGKSRPASQDITGRKTSYSRKLSKEDSVLDWTKPAEQLEREIRAFIEWPKSRCTLKDLEIVITKAHVTDESGTPGVWTIKDKQPVVYCGDKALAIDMLKPAGKKEMTGEAFLAGYRKLLD